MKSLSAATKNARSSRLQAAALLRLPGLRLHLVTTAILCLCFWVGIVYIGECVFAAAPWETLREQAPLWYEWLDKAFYLLDVLVILLVGLPLLFGACMIFVAAADGKKEPMTTLFCAFASPAAYGRALTVMLGLLFPTLVQAGGTLYLVQLASATEQVGMTVLWYGLAVVLILAVWLLSGCHDAVLRLCYLHPDTPAHRLFCTSRRLTKHRLVSLFLFKLHYVGWALLSVLSLGIVLIFHALPAFALAHTARLDLPNESNTST